MIPHILTAVLASASFSAIVTVGLAWRWGVGTDTVAPARIRDHGGRR